jgi:hypothetical protein
MDLPSSPQVPSGPMTRARARAIETEVTSLLNDIPYDPCETWLLPQSGMLCVLRYQEDLLGDARDHGQVYMFTDKETRRRRPLKCYSGRTSGLGPGHPAPGDSSHNNSSADEELQAPDIRPPARTSGPRSEIWPEATEPGQWSAWTSGPMARISGSS